MAINDFLFGNEGGNQQLSTLNGQQNDVLQQILKMVQQSGGGVEQAFQLLQGYLDPNSEQYKNFEAPYLQQFNQQTIPGLAEKFAGYGGGLGGGLSSSGFG